ncbi:MAG: YIP1 family protein, partial [Myxococcaceae bacterium]
MLLLLKSPTAFFSSFQFETKNSKTLLLGTACLFFGLFSESGIQIYLVSLATTFKPVLDLIPLSQLEIIRKEALLTLVFSPIIAFFGIYLFAGALHLTLRGFSFGDATKIRYESTLHLVALCQLPMLFAIIPVFGPMVASIWVFVLLMKGLRQI